MSWTWYQSVPSSEEGANKSFPSQIHVSPLFRCTLALVILVLEVIQVTIIFIVVKHFLSDTQSISVQPSSINHALEVYRSLSTYNSPLILSDFDASHVVRTPANDALWQQPKDVGVIRIPSVDADAYGLPASETLEPLFPQDSLYQMTVFHQIHCLSRIRDTLVPADNENDGGNEVRVTNHTLHCVDYLHKTLMGNADTMLDPLTDPRHGIRSPKTCRDWQAVRAWWEDNKFDQLDEFWELKGYVKIPDIHVLKNESVI